MLRRTPHLVWLCLLILSITGCGGGGSTIVTSPLPPPPSLTPEEINRRYNYAPSARIVSGVVVLDTSGTVQNAGNLLLGETTSFIGKGSSVTIDFGKEVSGLITLSFAGASDKSQRLGLAFSESPLYVGPISDRSNGSTSPDGAIYADVSGAGTYTMPTDKLRGGFRFLTLFLDSTGSVDVNNVSLQISTSPAMSDMRAYSGYFYSNDDLLNRIWYAGAYTVQTNTIAPSQGRIYPPVTSGWELDAVLGSGQSVVVDGAKRDRTLFPGDLAIAQPTAFVSTGDTDSVRNTLDSLYQYQLATGEMPYAGLDVVEYGSDTYHLWSLIATANHYFYSGDKTWLDSRWSQYKSAVQYSLGKIDANGVMNVDHYFDWGRTANTKGEVIEANALLYRVLLTGAELARVEGDSTTQSSYTSAAQNLKQTINAMFWDSTAGAYANKPGATLYPQDGNSLALWFGIADSVQAAKVSQLLRNNWNSFGAQTPEKPNMIAPFIGSMEVNAHFAAGNDQAALDLIRLEWGYMLNSPIGTKSTIWEGYLADGTLEPQGNGISWYPPPYLGSYMSLAHGWSTGPTSTLTFLVLGISPATGGIVAYTMIPHPADLTHAEGALKLPSGTLTAAWTRDPTAGIFTQTVAPPAGVLGNVGVPTYGHSTVIYVDKQLVWNGCTTPSNVANVGFANATTDGVYVYLNQMNGAHTIDSSAKCP